jgi:hypothetical protein
VVPRFGFGQIIKGFLRENQVEITEVKGDVPSIVGWFRVSFEGFGKPLGNCRGCLDMFGFWEESSGPNLIALLKLFLIRTFFGFQFELVIFIVHVFYESQEWASLTGINPLGILLLGLLLISLFCLAANTAPGQAPGHLDHLSMEVNFRIMSLKPGKPQYHALLAQLGHSE